MANLEIAVTLSFAVQFFVRDRKKSGGKKNRWLQTISIQTFRVLLQFYNGWFLWKFVIDEIAI